MRVLGVDPGTRKLGWGVVERVGTRMTHVAHGTIHLPTGDLADRLVQIDQALEHVIALHRPEAAAVEALFYAKNAQSAAKLGHARGVVLLVLRRAGLPLGEYPPAQVKRTVVGGGRAAKGQVGQLVKSMLSLVEMPQEDAADALAVALTHLATQRFSEALAGAVAAKARPRRRR
jgi:crossover junction endodeoxyribonuclease RuvC